MNWTSTLFAQPVAMFPVLPLMPGVGQSFELLGTLGVASVHRGCVVCSVVQLFSATQLLKVSSTVSNVNLTFEYEVVP
jgi:hypothetical protein